MKLTPYYLLFSLAFLGIMGQKAYEYKLEQDDKKEVFCKNALFLLQAPDSLSNRVVNFDLPYDSLVNFMKKKILFDSCENYYFEYVSIVSLQKKENNKEYIILKVPLTTEYVSDCFPIGMVATSCMDISFKINYINNNTFSLPYNEIEFPLDSLKQMILKNGIKNYEYYPPFIKIIIDKKISQEFIETVLTTYQELKLESLNKKSLSKFGKNLCDLNKAEVYNLKKEVLNIPATVYFERLNLPPSAEN